jgi:hypothetical protein
MKPVTSRIALMILMALALAAAAGAATAPCIMPDNGTGTVTLPPAGCSYLSPDQVHMIIDGLPPGTTIILAPIHQAFICRTSGCGTAGGPLGGEVENFSSTAVFQLSGTGALSGWTRTVTVPLGVQIATAPRTLGAPVQTFATNMERISGAITGDPDFALFQVNGGTASGFSSPGSTTLTRLSGGAFNVNSTFNVGYSITFKGAAGGHLAGFEGTTKGTVKMSATASDQVDSNPGTNQ